MQESKRADGARIKQLEKEKQELEAALAQAQLKILALESTIELSEQIYGIRAKKQPDLNQQSARPRKRRQ